LWLAVEKLAPGGRMAVIVPAGWMNAGAAGFLREKLAEELTLDELFLFGSYKLFAPEHGSAPTPTVESAILIATKERAPKGHKLRVVALEDEARAGNPEREALLGEMTRRAAGRQGRRGGIHVHDLRQSDLRADRPWPVKHGAKDTATLVVRHLDAMLSQNDSVEPLATSWKVFQGIQTGADAYSNRVAKRLSAAERARLEAMGARIGAPILELSPGAERTPPWSQHPGLLARSPESRALLYGAIDEADFASLVWIDRGTTVPPEIEAELAPWRTVLANRAEILRNPGRRWLECAWPRARDDMLAPKVIALYRTDRGRFALDETGEWQPSIKATLAVGRAQNAPVAYLCGLLNSELIDLWYAVRGKTPWHVRRNYEPKRMNEIPYRRPDGDPRADEVANLVRMIAANRTALLPHRAVAPELGRIVKDPWKTGPFTIAPATIISDLDAGATVSVRLDPELERVLGQAPLGRATRTDDGRVWTYKRKQTGYITGPSDRLDLLLALLPEADDPASVILPRDMARFTELVDRRRGQIAALLDEGRELVEQVERVVCSLYGLPDDLADAVVEHAVQRAGSGSRGAQPDHA